MRQVNYFWLFHISNWDVVYISDIYLHPDISASSMTKKMTFFVLYSPSLLFRHYFLHLCKDIRYLTYLLSSLFFPMHTFRILISTPLLPWSFHKSQYYQQTASFMVILSLLHPLACPLSLKTGMELTLIPGAVQP